MSSLSEEDEIKSGPLAEVEYKGKKPLKDMIDDIKGDNPKVNLKDLFGEKDK